MGFYLTVTSRDDKKNKSIRKDNYMTQLEMPLDEAIESETMIEQLKKADHFYIVHYCKKRDQIEERRCYWDDKSKIWETNQGKVAITCVAMDNEEHTIDGYRTFTNIFQVVGRKAIRGSEAMQ